MRHQHPPDMIVLAQWLGCRTYLRLFVEKLIRIGRVVNSDVLLSRFLADRFRFRMPMLSGRMLDGCIDLTTDENGQPSDIKPKHQHDDRAQRAIGPSVSIKEVQISTQS